MNILSEKDELLLEKNLVWIFADRRSGTTWLGKELLSSHTISMDEPLIGLHLGRVVEKEERFIRTFDTEQKRPDYFFSKKNQDIWLLFLRKLILNRIYDQFKTLSDKIVIKEPTGSMAADIISQTLPNSKIIILLRNGKDIVDSKIDENSPGGWELKQNKEGVWQKITAQTRRNFIKIYSKRWISLMDILMKTYDKHQKDLRYLIRYEDLRKNTLSELRKIFRFIGVDVDEDTLKKIVKKYEFENIPKEKTGKGQFRRFASPGKWKEHFNEEEKLLMDSIMKDTLKKLNY